MLTIQFLLVCSLYYLFLCRYSGAGYRRHHPVDPPGLLPLLPRLVHGAGCPGLGPRPHHRDVSDPRHQGVRLRVQVHGPPRPSQQVQPPGEVRESPKRRPPPETLGRHADDAW